MNASDHTGAEVSAATIPARLLLPTMGLPNSPAVPHRLLKRINLTSLHTTPVAVFARPPLRAEEIPEPITSSPTSSG